MSKKQARYITYLLRHGAVKEKLDINKEGYVKANDIIQKINITEDDLCDIVKADAKGRFSTTRKDGLLYIRANQGHSAEVAKMIDFSLIWDEISPEPCVHATYSKYLPSILKEGLKIQDRSHIHICPKEDIKKMTRKDADVFLEIDMESAIKDGIRFFKSENGVILTHGVDGVLSPEYFSVK